MVGDKKPARRARGQGGVYWDAERERFIATATVGYSPAGKRILRKGTGKTEAQAQAKLKERIREYEAGLMPGAQHYTVRHAVEDWPAYGLAGRSKDTISKCETICRIHIVPSLGARKLRDLRASDIEKWLADRARVLATGSLQVAF